jgi:hypothetical protein
MHSSAIDGRRTPVSISCAQELELSSQLLAMNEGRATVDEVRRANELLSTNAEARKVYFDHVLLFVALRWSLQSALPEHGLSLNQDGSPCVAEPGALSVPGSTPSSTLRLINSVTSKLTSSSLAAALLVALLCYGTFALLSWNLRPDQLPSAANREGSTVAIVSSAADVHWSPETTSKTNQSPVRLGEPLTIESGVVQLELKRGVTLLVEGPARWSIEGDNRATLKSGKIVAKVPPQAIGFTIETPEVKIVDLGTEFGVVADPEGKTDVHVLRGRVEVKQSRTDVTKPISFVLSAGGAIRANVGQQAATIPFNGNQFASTLKSVVRSNDAAPTTSIDLADIIAGGDGRQHRRNLGIDPTNGQVLEMHRNDYSRFDYVSGDGLYHRTPNRPFVDGVAVVDATSGPVQLDSAGHAFDQFLTKDGRAYGPVWPGGALPEPRGDGAISSTFDGKFDYADAPHGFIALVPNKLITFDLDAIRRAYPGCSLTAFRSVAGNTKAGWSRTDIWVFVDGTLCFDRQGIKGNEGPQTIDVALSPTAKFLTLVATDGGDTPHFDHVIFGDPRIELTKNP